MPTPESNATQPWLVSQADSPAKIIGKFGGVDQLRNAMLNWQTTFRNHHYRTRDLLLSGRVELKTEAA